MMLVLHQSQAHLVDMSQIKGCTELIVRGLAIPKYNV